MVMTIASSTGFDLEKQSIVIVLDGNTLYVGGSGPNNYTKIQDAVDNTSNGDTVFVYDDSSPYYEHVVINNSITLLGENRDTTIIDGNNDGFVIDIKADKVTISGFTIQNATIGIHSFTNRNHIIDNKILDQYHNGITLRVDYNNYSKLGAYSNRIDNNYIANNRLRGISINDYDAYDPLTGGFNIIKGNILTENGRGIEITVSCHHNIIYGNIIVSNKEEGIALDINFMGIMNKVIKNHIEQNGIGIRVYGPSSNIIRNNNIMNNTINATFDTFIFRQCNLWIGNYWGRSYLGPKSFKGEREIPTANPWQDSHYYPCHAFDLRPALKPYDIGV